MAYSHLLRSGFVSSKVFHGLAASLLLGVVLTATGCHPAITDPKDPKFIVAEKGKWQVTRAELDKEINDFLKQRQMTPAQAGPANMSKLETAMLDNIIMKKLLLDKAAALPLKDVDKDEAAELDKLKGAAASPEFDQQLKAAGLTMDDIKKRIHEKVIIGKVLDAEAFKDIEPTEQEINDVYMKNQQAFNIPAKLRASRILVLVDDKATPADKAAKKKIIDKAHDRVAKGEDFAKVAMEVSEDQYSKSKGGDIGFFQKGEAEAQFDDVAFTIKPNTLSPVFQTPLGYQFLKVTDSQKAGIVPIADARPYISNKLRQMKMGQQEEVYTKKLLADSGVTYHLVRVDLTPPQGQGAPTPGTVTPDTTAAPEAQAPAPAPAAPPAH